MCCLSILKIYNNKLSFYNLTVFPCVAPCTYSWTRHENTNVNDGQRVNTANTLAECWSACINNASCTGVDWTGTPGECWMSGSWSGQRNDGTASGVTHYDLTRDCKGQTLASTTYQLLTHSLAYLLTYLLTILF